MALSTDKAVNPVNLYGATKLAAEKLITQANAYSGDSPARFANVRYGNVVGSRGSVVPLFRRQALDGAVTITDERMTRFWITLEQAVRFVIRSMEVMTGGEVFVPKIPSTTVLDIADVLAPGAERRIIGIRPGEKLHEVMLTEDESRHAHDIGFAYVIAPEIATWTVGPSFAGGTPCAPGFRYASDTNDHWLTQEELRAMLADGDRRRW